MADCFSKRNIFIQGTDIFQRALCIVESSKAEVIPHGFVAQLVLERQENVMGFISLPEQGIIHVPYFQSFESQRSGELLIVTKVHFFR